MRKRLSGHRPPWPKYREGAHEPPAWAGKVRSWVVVREAVDVAVLDGFDLVVITEPQRALDSWLGPAERELLRSRTIRLVAHVPLVRATSASTPPPHQVGRDGLNAERWYLDAVTRIRTNSSLSWDGCYLDDMAEVIAKPRGGEAALELIAIARAAGRGGIVIVQSVSDDAVTGAADLVGVESPLA